MMNSNLYGLIYNISFKVFHSLDKLTSFFLHFFPPLHLHLFRCTKPSIFPLIYLYLYTFRCTKPSIYPLINLYPHFIFISLNAPNHPFTRLSSFLELFLLSWGLIPCKAIKKEDSLSLHEGLVLPMLLYAIWQV